ncbi:MAG: STAS domain-containing protein [Solirubrobacterales bacterium]
MRTGELALERTDAGVAVLTISGEHDLSTAPLLRRRLDGLLDQGTPTVVDLSPATFVDSSILGAILDGRRRAAKAAIGFAVVHADGAEAVDRVLEVTGLRAELPVHSRREEAFSEVSKDSGKSPA